MKYLEARAFAKQIKTERPDLFVKLYGRDQVWGLIVKQKIPYKAGYSPSTLSRPYFVDEPEDWDELKKAV